MTGRVHVDHTTQDEYSIFNYIYQWQQIVCQNNNFLFNENFPTFNSSKKYNDFFVGYSFAVLHWSLLANWTNSFMQGNEEAMLHGSCGNQATWQCWRPPVLHPMMLEGEFLVQGTEPESGT